MTTPHPAPATLGQLKASGWESVPVKEEIRRNAVARIAAGEPLFDIMRVQALVEAAGMVEREGTWLDAEEEA